MKMIICQQGTPEWLEARAGAVTASTFSQALEMTDLPTPQQSLYINAMLAGRGEAAALAAGGYKAKPTAAVVAQAIAGLPVGKPSPGSERLAADTAFERISFKPYGEVARGWVLERGHTLEAMARERYEGKHGIMAYEAGIVKSDDDWFGYSTDGLVEPIFAPSGQFVECEGLIEIKCPVDTLKVREMFLTGDVSEYRHQMQGGMWLTGARWCDLIMFAPDLRNAGTDLFVKRVHRDDAFIDDMVDRLMRFKERVLYHEALFRRGPTPLALAS